jgi:L-malate glycosyltransferase
VHHAPNLNRDELVMLFAVHLQGVECRYVPPAPLPSGQSRNPWTRYREARAWHSELSAPYDLFVDFTHNIPPFCHARTGVLVVLFPLYASPIHWTLANGAGGKWSVGQRVSALYHSFEWRQRLRSYHVKLAISEFSRHWTRELWGAECGILSPPVDTDFGVTAKENAILSVGRFVSSKKQLALIAAFGEARKEGLSGWEYWCAGGHKDAAEEAAYFLQVRDAALKCGAQLLVNLPRPELRGRFERCKVFWHAMGYGEDDRKEAWRMEHFGIVTVEAMAAGCVPVVINKGAQPELVRHGVDGFLWDTIEELKAYTITLASDEALRARMAGAARARAASFDRASFVRRFQDSLSGFAH